MQDLSAYRRYLETLTPEEQEQERRRVDECLEEARAMAQCALRRLQQDLIDGENRLANSGPELGS